MAKTMVSPSKFILGAGEIENLGKYVSGFGKKAILIATDNACKRIKSQLDKAFEGVDYLTSGFNGECSRVEINRLIGIVKENNCDVIIGLGGGKVLDAAKVVADSLKTPIIIFPTIAATDAPTSALSVIYSEEGVFEEYVFFPKNPDLVLVDSDIITKAPVEYLVAGMGDALATYFESRACEKSYSDNFCGGKRTKAVMAMAKTCYDILLEDSVKAKAACEANVVTEALENIIEANILLSGIGFESAGLAGAHAIHNGMTALEETHKYNHGEKVAFGVIVQLILENAPMKELMEVINYCKSVGLPTTMKQLGVNDLSDERLMEVAKLVCADGDTVHNMPFKVTPETVAAAVRSADILGAY